MFNLFITLSFVHCIYFYFIVEQVRGFTATRVRGMGRGEGIDNSKKMTISVVAIKGKYIIKGV
jgi:hypothetical protein